MIRSHLCEPAQILTISTFACLGYLSTQHDWLGMFAKILISILCIGWDSEIFLPTYHSLRGQPSSLALVKDKSVGEFALPMQMLSEGQICEIDFVGLPPCITIDGTMFSSV